jgi:thiamine biosynthesis lipoprotein
VADSSSLPGCLQILEGELAQMDRACSRFRADSELSQLNGAGGKPTKVDDLFMQALEVGLRAAQLTDGAVDPTVGKAMCAIGYDRDFESIGESPRSLIAGALVPGWRSVQIDRTRNEVRLDPTVELDLGATAKALAADRAARRMYETYEAGVLVNIGGDLSVAGEAPPGGWRIRVSDDHRDQLNSDGETVSIVSGGLATSSTTVRRWQVGSQHRHHIIDPRTGTSAEVIWRTASVAAASCVDANTASTAVIVRGLDAPAWLIERGLPGRLVHRDGRVVRVSGWAQHKS